MKKHLIIQIFLLFAIQLFGQTTFKDGTIKLKSGAVKNGYIMSYGTILPEVIHFKENLEEEGLQEIPIQEISELRLETIRYIEKSVLIEFLDKSFLAFSQNNNRIFELTTENLFLETLAEFGRFKIYSYYDEQNNQYFFVEEDEIISILKYKVITENGKKIHVRDFRNQLLTKFPIKDFNNKGLIGGVNYKEGDILNYLMKWSEQQNLNFIRYKNGHMRDAKDVFNLTPKLGFYWISQETSSQNDYLKTTSQGQQFNFGVDLEYFFNSTYKKYSITLSYSYFLKTKDEGQFSFGIEDDSEFSNSLSLNILGLNLRRYFRLSNDQFFYGNIGIAMHSSKGQTNYYYPSTNTIIVDLKHNNNENNLGLVFGLGYQFKNAQLELKYIPKMSGEYNSYNDNATSNSWTYNQNLINISIGYNVL